MKKVYLDNAATTEVDKDVIEEVCLVLENNYGNPSSVHSLGRESKVLIENARKTISGLIHADPSEIFFNSGGTEANNTVINRAVHCLGVDVIISTKIEHGAILSACTENIKENKNVILEYVNNCNEGYADLHHLKTLIEKHADKKILVSIMHANNEIGSINNIKAISELCLSDNVFFHSDAVQTITHKQLNLKDLSIDFLSCSAHKFHGPKGVGFLYINKKNIVKAFIHGGGQERSLRAGTENIYGIVGMSKAMEIGYKNLEQNERHLNAIKLYMVEQLESLFHHHNLDVKFNGNPRAESLSTVLNVCFPKTDVGEMFLYYLDMKGICASSGSACSSGSNKRSHVLDSINSDLERPSIRFSFSKYTTKEDINYTIQCIKDIYKFSS